MHPWERDARMLREAVYKGPQHGILVEIARTRSSEELLGAGRAYPSLFDHSIEEDIAFHIQNFEKRDLHDHLILKLAVQCLSKPQTYFIEVLDVSLKIIEDEIAKASVARSVNVYYLRPLADRPNIALLCRCHFST
ncbi:hypothetical protein ACH5RR_001080 [Cinchona calisaya]|uniref:Uncharacterized protein n=1 Tax=Cinchona calisaya TaxID=153742 RepID=A0ABD3B2M2_9GENT